jgi:hypothetical protein
MDVESDVDQSDYQRQVYSLLRLMLMTTEGMVSHTMHTT